MPEDDIECESLAVVSIDILLAYKNKYYLQTYLNNCAYIISDKRMTYCLGTILLKLISF